MRELPLRLAASIAVEFVATWPAVTVKEAVVEPAQTTVEAGMVTSAEPVPRPKATVTASIALDARVTIHVSLPSETIDVDAHVRVEISAAGLIVSVPALSVAAMDSPVPETAVSPVSPSVDVAGAVADTAKLIEAKMPFAIELVFKPHTMHRTCPVPVVQDNDFPAAVVAPPAVILKALITLVEYVRVHSRLDGSEVLDDEVIEMLA